jgi:chemotaxis protein MotA
MRRAARYGIPLLGIALLTGVWLSADGAASFVHLPSLLLTVGGTALVTFFSYPTNQLRELASAVREALSSGQPVVTELEHVKALARRYRVDGIRGLDGAGAGIENPFLLRGLELLGEWKAADEVRTTLEAEHLRLVTHYEDCRRILLTIGRLFPAFGLIGTLVGLVLILHEPTTLSVDTAGPALSLAVLTTLYGALFANAVVLPIEAKLQTFIDHLRIRFEVGLRATLLIGEQAYPSLIEEQLACLVGAGAGQRFTGSRREPALAHAEARA